MGFVNDLADVDEDAAAALLRARKARKALELAPDLAAHLRALMLPSDGRTEVGDSPELRTPLLTGVTDAADGLLRQLLEWADWWSKRLDIDGPVAASFARHDYQGSHASMGFSDFESVGFRAGTSPEMAAAIVRALVVWLLVHDDEMIVADPFWAGLYQDDVSKLVWRLRAESGQSPARPAREPSARPCPVCGELAMRAEYFGSSFQAAELRGEQLLNAVEGIDVRCGYCGHVETASATRIARWLS